MSSIQDKINIKDIKDGVVIMENNNFRAVLMCSSLNFFLKSEEEQTALTYAYQDFLNSLDFSIQILITSRRFDLSSYIGSLEERLKTQDNELLKIQTNEYIDFIKSLTETTNVMSSMFFIVVPFSPIEQKQKGLLEKIIEPFEKKEKEEAKQDFEQMKTQLWHRLEQVSSGLSRLGIKAVPLTAEELVELYYKMYNPEAKEKPKLTALKEEQMLQ